ESRVKEDAVFGRKSRAQTRLAGVHTDAGEQAGQKIAANVRLEPYRHRERCPDRGKEEEGAKSGRKKSDTARRRCGLAQGARVNGGDWHQPAPPHVSPPANMPRGLRVTAAETTYPAAQSASTNAIARIT